MADLSALRQQLVADIDAATDLDVVADPKKAHAPCVLVGPIVAVRSGGLCAWEADVPVWIVSPAPGDARAVDFLAAYVTDVLDVCGDEAEATLGTYNPGQGDLPAYEVTSTLIAKE